MKIKNLLRAILAIGLSLISLFSVCGCRNAGHVKMWAKKDGYFSYYKLGKTYAIVDNGDVPYPEILVIPAYYKGKEVSYVYYETDGYFRNAVGPEFKDVDCVYYPYTDDLSALGVYYYHIGSYESIVPSEWLCPPRVFLANCKTTTGAYWTLDGRTEENVVDALGYDSHIYIYCTSLFYDVLKENNESFKEEYKNREINGYVLRHDRIYREREETRETIIANTSYMFNYDGAPNEGYFFINDFERGGLIENTPYEPLREGYTFGGWYKDSACTEAWDFTVDKLPEAEYDEEGYVTEFVETKLYAKWTKDKAWWDIF